MSKNVYIVITNQERAYRKNEDDMVRLVNAAWEAAIIEQRFHDEMYTDCNNRYGDKARPYYAGRNYQHRTGCIRATDITDRLCLMGVGLTGLYWKEFDDVKVCVRRHVLPDAEGTDCYILELKNLISEPRYYDGWADNDNACEEGDF